MKFTLFAFMLFIPFCSFAETEIISNGKNTIKIVKTCAKNSCNVTYKNKKNGGNVISDVANNIIKINWIDGKRIANIHISCGSYCTADFYLGEETELVTFSNVLLLDKKTGCIAYVSDSDALVFQHMFSKTPVSQIDRENSKYQFMESATIMSVISPVSYKNGFFTATYMDNQEIKKQLLFNSKCR